MIHPGLYHTSVIEWAFSAMETAAVAGRNVANAMARAYAHECKGEGKFGGGGRGGGQCERQAPPSPPPDTDESGGGGGGGDSSQPLGGHTEL